MIPFRWLREFIVSLANLLEAEGRALRSGIIRTGIGIAGVCIAAVILLGGLGLLMASGIVALSSIMSPALALLSAGLGCLLVAGVVAWTMVRQKR